MIFEAQGIIDFSDFHFGQAALFNPGNYNLMRKKRGENQGYPDLDGYGWYRKVVKIPADWKGKDVYVKFAVVNDSYDLFINVCL